MTSTCLLVTSYATRELTQFDADGIELRRVHLPDYITPQHAVESPTGTFIISHYIRQSDQNAISEVDTYKLSVTSTRLLVMSEYIRQDKDQVDQDHISDELCQFTSSLVVDSKGNVLMADYENCCILLLDSRLSLRCVIIDEHQLNQRKPLRLCYMEQSGQLLVGSNLSDVALYDVLRHSSDCLTGIT